EVAREGREEGGGGGGDWRIGVAEPGQPGPGRGANDADQRSHGERQTPRGERGRERPPGAEKERLEIGVNPVGRGLEKDAPVPVVVHASPLSPNERTSAIRKSGCPDRRHLRRTCRRSVC